MQFSNHPKEDSVEHVVISREDAEMEAGREELGGYDDDSGDAVSSRVIKNEQTKPL